MSIWNSVLPCSRATALQRVDGGAVDAHALHRAFRGACGWAGPAGRPGNSTGAIPAELLAPIVEARLEHLGRHGAARSQHAYCAYGGAGSGSDGRRPAAKASYRAHEVGQEEPQRDAVEHDVVQHEIEPVIASREQSNETAAHHRTALEVEQLACVGGGQLDRLRLALVAGRCVRSSNGNDEVFVRVDDADTERPSTTSNEVRHASLRRGRS